MTRKGSAQSGDRPARGARRRGALCAPVLLLAALLATDGAFAQSAGPWLASALDILDPRRQSAPVLSINDAASRAQDRFGGQVISISPAEQDGRRGYRVKILLESGRVKTLFVEARTGSVIDRREQDR